MIKHPDTATGTTIPSHQAGHTMRPNEMKFTSMDLQTVEVDGTFEGYASLFNREDMGRDIIAPGAFAQSLRKRGTRGIKMLFQHDPNQPIGLWEILREDARGLFAKGRLMQDVSKAREVLALMRAGALDGLSIGFRAQKGKRNAATGVRRLEQVDLWEVSIVTFPMLPQARVTRVKTSPFKDRLPTEREFERWLARDAGLTRTEARAVLRDGLNGLKALRDAGGGARDEDRLLGRIAQAANRLRCN